MNVLIVEDSPFQAKFVALQIRELMKDMNPEITISHTLEETRKKMESMNFDIVLLDLNLPDSSGLETYYELNKIKKKIPVIILSSIEQKEIAVQAIKTGAQDYLYKTEAKGGPLMRAILFAIERNKQFIQLMDELDSLLRIGERILIPNSDQDSPRKSSDLFIEFEKNYKKILDIVVERRVYKNKEDFSQRIQQMAKDLCGIKADSFYILEIHYAAMFDKIHQTSAQEFRAAMDEGRLLLIELMSQLVNIYRDKE
jgi:DNA-binding response OmpR family regulator